MRLTTKGRYAVTAVLDLALHQDEGPVSLAAISERQDISSRPCDSETTLCPARMPFWLDGSLFHPHATRCHRRRIRKKYTWRC